MRAEHHPRQRERLAALHAYNVLDTPRESDFDDVVALAADICQVPISVVNLIDADRQWFKAEVGLGVRETPIDSSICAHAILQDAFVEIPDMRLDRRMADNPLCLGDPALRFYAGALLRSDDELPIGTLCVLDYQPRKLSDLQRRTLVTLGRQVMAQLELRKALARQQLLAKEIDHRVKNSLQGVQAMLQLQVRTADNEEVRRALRMADARVARISHLHELLYTDDGTERIELISYAARLRDLLHSTLPPGVNLAIEMPRVAVNAETASAIGVIVSEFVMNSAKHGFPDSRPGLIRICLRDSTARFDLVCEDDGVGYTASAEKGGLGMRLIEASAQKLGGTVDRLSGPGGFRLRIQLPRSIEHGS